MKSMTTKLILVMAIGIVVDASTVAGTLDPPGPPAPTMVTLQQIYDKITGQLGLVALAKTGQTGCWNPSGAPIGCTGSGQDAAFQRGASVSPRFTDNADGTVKDNLTGLIWLKNANCFGEQLWAAALSSANSLVNGSCGLTDGSSAGAWRLPNVRELQSLIDFGQLNPSLPLGHPFSGVQLSDYWSSTTGANAVFAAWHVRLDFGAVDVDRKEDFSYYVWPVRGGQ